MIIFIWDECKNIDYNSKNCVHTSKNHKWFWKRKLIIKWKRKLIKKWNLKKKLSNSFF